MTKKKARGSSVGGFGSGIEPSIMALDSGGGNGIAWAPLSILGSSEPDMGLIKSVTIDGLKSRYGCDPEVAATFDILVKMREINCSVLVYESYLPRPGQVYRVASWSPLRINAMLLFALSQKWWGGTLISQSPSEKGTITDARLKRWNLLREPKSRFKHENDALRHLIIALRRAKQTSIS